MMTDEQIKATRERCEAATIRGFPNYEISTDGRVFSKMPWRGTAERELRQQPNSHGYMRVRMVCEHGRTSKFVHLLVADAFLGEKPDKTSQIRHLNGDKLDNRACNLAWGTAKENADDRTRHGTTATHERNGMAKLKTSDVVAIKEFSKKGFSQRKIARIIGVSQRTIGGVLRGQYWK